MKWFGNLTTTDNYCCILVQDWIKQYEPIIVLRVIDQQLCGYVVLLVIWKEICKGYDRIYWVLYPELTEQTFRHINTSKRPWKGLVLNSSHPHGCPHFNFIQPWHYESSWVGPNADLSWHSKVQNRQRYNLKNPTESYTLFPGQNITLVLNISS